MYGILLVAITVTRLAIWGYATGRSHLLVAPVSTRAQRTGFIIGAGPAVSYTLTVSIASEPPTVSLVIYAAVPVLYFIAFAGAHCRAAGISGAGGHLSKTCGTPTQPPRLDE